MGLMCNILVVGPSGVLSGPREVEVGPPRKID